MNVAFKTYRWAKSRITDQLIACSILAFAKLTNFLVFITYSEPCPRFKPMLEFSPLLIGNYTKGPVIDFYV